MMLKMKRDAKVYIDPKTGVEIHCVGYAMALFLYALSMLDLSEEMPEGILSATGEGEVPGQRPTLAAAAMLIGYAEPVRPSKDANTVFVKLTALGKKAAANNEVIGVMPAEPMPVLYRRMQSLIERQRAQRRQGKLRIVHTGSQRKSA